jgi:hypothetical protein
MRQLGWVSLVFAGVLTLVVFSGCGPGGPTRQEVSGTVEFDGQPVEDGIIYFEPQEGQGSMDGSSILSGTFTIPQKKGLFPGKYRVAIYVGDGIPTSGKAEPFIPPPGFKRGVERAGPEWNTKSKQLVEVKEGQENRFDFKIPKRRD